MTKLGTLLRKRNDEGASAVEYGLLVALIAVVIASVVYFLGQALNTQFTDVKDCVESASTCESVSSE
jgi:pilus assembly protein Flp/PilA